MSEISAKKLSFPVSVRVDESGRPFCFCGCDGLLVEIEPGTFMCPDWAPIHQQVTRAIGQISRDLFIAGSGLNANTGPVGLLGALSASAPLWPMESGLSFQRAGERRTADLREFAPPVDWDAALRTLERASA